MPPPPPPASEAVQQDRAVRTRLRILEAAVTALVDDGYRGATTARVQALAGVSRGALLHHFPTRESLLLAATEHLARRRARWLRQQMDAHPDPPDRLEAGMSLLWQAMSGPLFAAATELWIASRTDEALREVLLVHERELGRAARVVLAEAMGVPDPADPTFATALDLALQVLRGAALTALLRTDARWERQVVAEATEVFQRHHRIAERSVTQRQRGS